MIYMDGKFIYGMIKFNNDKFMANSFVLCNIEQFMIELNLVWNIKHPHKIKSKTNHRELFNNDNAKQKCPKHVANNFIHKKKMLQKQ